MSTHPPQVDQGDEAQENRAVIKVRSGPLAAPVLTRVVAMMLVRVDCPIDRLDDAVLICDALAATAPEQAANGQLEFTVLTRPGQLEMRVGALVSGGARSLLAATEIPGVGDMLSPIAGGVRIEAAAQGAGNDELVFELAFPTPQAGEPVPDLGTAG